MTTVEISMTLALAAVAIMLLARARRPGRTDRQRKEARTTVTLMFVLWIGGILLGKIVLWTS
ncbi:hypothetical protein MF672_028390 [Actinomadura sp. ATCC 31491]|uniref:Uncharacterized protein n=1 Tax=Actinomadura luzonensis TaxID=2805427 RepID=A0ABT0FZU6_9ACTN|nr:hypothetical protein [Actinomadura luzonensis]MCK2217683.1 hypothetical protein [Actinomadura luzonensis]